MSETTEQPAAEEQRAAADTSEQQTQDPAATEQQQQEEKAAKEPPWFMKRIDSMNRRNGDLARELEQAKAELQVLRAGRQTTEEGEGEKSAQRQPPELTREAILAEAERLRSEERAAEARNDLIERGQKELGFEEWNRTTGILAAMGAQANQAFMDALYELPEAPKLIAALANEPNKLETLLAKRPAAMATEMARMAVGLAAKPKQHSSASAPIEPVGARGSQPAPDVYDTKNMSMKEWVALRNKQAPPHLGGQRKSA